MKINKNYLLLAIIVPLFFIACDYRVENLGVFGTSRLEHVLGQDGVTSIPFSDEVTLWTFGDTITGSWKKGVSPDAPFTERAAMTGMIHNTLAFTEKVTENNITSLKFTYYREKGKLASFLKHRPGENPSLDRLWAFDGIRIDNRVYVYYVHVYIENPAKALSFRVKSVGLARWDIPAEWKPGDPVSFVRLKDIFTGSPPAFGAAVFRKDGYIYTIGQYSTRNFRAPVKIARVPVERIEDSGSYEFLTANGTWTRILAKGDSFLNDVAGECSLSYNEYLRSYIIVYCQVFSGKVILVNFKDFAGLHGAEKKVIYAAPEVQVEDKVQAPWYYSGKEVISFGKTMYAIYIHPTEYQPYLLRIRF